jgi:hypothetical protein
MLRCSNRFAAALIVLALTSLQPASAQQPSATAMAAAKELLSVKGSMKIYDPVVTGIVEKAKLVFLRIRAAAIRSGQRDRKALRGALQ